MSASFFHEFASHFALHRGKLLIIRQIKKEFWSIYIAIEKRHFKQIEAFYCQFTDLLVMETCCCSVTNFELSCL